MGTPTFARDTFTVCTLYTDLRQNDAEENSVVIEMQPTANSRKASLAKDLSAKFYASTWAKE